jgi:PadR family transcriptional regulator, regulatory protein PadR
MVALAPSEPRKGPVMLRGPLIGHIGKQVSDTDDEDKLESHASDATSRGGFIHGHRLISFASRHHSTVGSSPDSALTNRDSEPGQLNLPCGAVVRQGGKLQIAMAPKVSHRKMVEPDHREFLSGFIRLHILHHAAQEPLVGFWMIEELRRHGYEMSPGTIYPLLHGLQKRGYLSVEVRREGRRAWREYSATKKGKKALAAAKRKLRELFHELIE